MWSALGVEHGGVELPGEQVVAQLAAVLRRRRLRASRRSRSTVGVLRFAVDFGGDLADEAVDRRLRVGDVGRDALVDAAAGDVADEAAGQAAVAAFGERLFDRAVEVGVDLQALARQLPALAVVADLSEWRSGASSCRRTALLRFGGVDARRRRRRRSSPRRRSCPSGSCRRRRRRSRRGRGRRQPVTIAIFVLRPNSSRLQARRCGPDLRKFRQTNHSASRPTSLQFRCGDPGLPADMFRRVRSKDQVRKEVWKAMDREGVSRFPGAEGRIPNFAGAQAGRREARRAPALEAGAGDQGQSRLAADPRPPAWRWRRARR